MPLLSNLIVKCKTETLTIFERPEARAISGRYTALGRFGPEIAGLKDGNFGFSKLISEANARTEKNENTLEILQ